MSWGTLEKVLAVSIGGAGGSQGVTASCAERAAKSIVARVSQKAGRAGPGCVVVCRGVWGVSAWDAGAVGL